ncbi:MAG: hypothetical protein AAFY59_15715, partial [Pseudomonadota bacterium]
MIETEHVWSIDASVPYLDDTLLPHREVTSDFFIDETSFRICPACGWWNIIQSIQYDTPNMPYMAHQTAAGALLTDNVPDISAPSAEVRRYLCARFDSRFEIDPYQLEGIVASVFNSFG